MNLHPHLVPAAQLHQAGSLVEAEGLYKEFLENHPGDRVVLYLLGILHGQRADFQSAADYLRKSVEMGAAYLEAQLALGNAERELGRVSAAQVCYEKALEIDPKCFTASFGIGRCLRQSGHFRSAAEHFRHALKIKPDFAECMFHLGETLLLEGDLDKALYTLERCERLRSNRPEIQCSLGRVHELRKKFAAAESCFRKAIKIDSTYAEAYWRLGDRLRATGDISGAVANYRKAISLSPRDVFAQARYGHALLVSGPREKLKLLKQLQADHLYENVGESLALAKELARLYGYEDTSASHALRDFLDEWKPSQLYPGSWWQEKLLSFGHPEQGHDRILRGVISQIFSWSIPTREVLQKLAGFVGAARLNSLGAGAGYWEYLLNRHFSIPVVASDIALAHRFVDMGVADYGAVPVDKDDVIFIAWIPAGENAVSQVLQRMESGQKLVVVGEFPESADSPLTCATTEFFAELIQGFHREEIYPLTRFAYMRDSILLLIKA